MSADPFAAIEKLMSMAPINRLQCPQCGARDEFELSYTINFTSALDWDGPSKLITVDYDTEVLRRSIEDLLICTLCTHEFPIPDGWKLAHPYHKPKKVQKVALTKPLKPSH